MGEAALDAGFVGAVSALPVDHEIAVPPTLHEGLDHLRRMLQVRIHDHHGFALCMIEPGRDGDLLAEIAAEGDGADARLGASDLLDLVQGIVPAAVIDEDHLPDRSDPAEDGEQALAQRCDVRALVVHGDDDAELRRRHWKDP
jgi:hypothetical protein